MTSDKPGDSVISSPEANVFDLPDDKPTTGLSQYYITPGGEGTSHVDARQLVAIVELTKRPELDFQARILLLESDIRDAMALAARRLNDHAMKYSVSGFVWDLDDIVYEHGAARTITATLRIARK